MIWHTYLPVQMQTARWNHNQGVPWEDEDDVGDVEEAQWELPSCLAKKYNQQILQKYICGVITLNDINSLSLLD